MLSRLLITITVGCLYLMCVTTMRHALAEDPPPPQVLFKNVHVFDGTSENLSLGKDVLITGNLIEKVGKGVSARPDATVIDGGGRTLMPGLSDAHAHLTLGASPNALRNDLHWMYIGVLTGREAERMLLRGFTTIRDAGGPTYGLAKAIDEGVIPGPRIYPSGHFIGQTSGHTDFRAYNDAHPSFSGYRGYFEREWVFIADGPAQVTTAVRETLRLGATQIKLSVGGGVVSPYDPLDTIHYTVEEIRSAVNAAENWGTYVMVHAYHDQSVINALEAGVKSIEHGTLIVKNETMAMIKEKGAFYSPQALIFSPTEEHLASFPPAIATKAKPLLDNLDESMKLARRHGVKIAFGSDLVGSPEAFARQNLELGQRLKWFNSAEILRQATSVNAELFALSGPRNPYKDGPLGVIKDGAYADLLIVDGNPLEDIRVLEDPEKNLRLIMKDGKIYKNTL